MFHFLNNGKTLVLGMLSLSASSFLYFYNKPFHPQSLPIVKLQPFDLSPEALGPTWICKRPMRLGGPRLELETAQNTQIIAHLYGHAGSGITMAPGAARSLCLQIQKKLAEEENKNQKIAIIGAGIMGLMVAYFLVNELMIDPKNIQIFDKNVKDAEKGPSYMAAGLIKPTFLEGNNMEVREQCCFSYKFYDDILNGKKSDFHKEMGRKLPYYAFGLEDEITELIDFRYYLEGGLMKPGRKVLVDFETGVFQKAIEYLDAIFIETGLLMKDLKENLLTKGVSHTQKTIKSFSELSDKQIIVNATGNQSGQLTNDTNLRPENGDGFLICLRGKTNQGINYMYTDYAMKQIIYPNGMKVTQMRYSTPKRKLPGEQECEHILGGTSVEIPEELTETEEVVDFPGGEHVLEWNRALFYKLEDFN